MTTPVPDWFDVLSVVASVRDPASVRVARSVLESQVKVLEAQVVQLREMTEALGQLGERNPG